MRIKVKFIYSLMILFLGFFLNNANAKEEFVCPLCTHEGILTCPSGFIAFCDEKDAANIEPRCVFLENKYVAGCWKFIGIKKMDLNFNSIDFPPSLMIEVIGGGETYTLNKDTISCKKL